VALGVVALWEIFRDFIAAVADMCGHRGKILCFHCRIAGFCGLAVWLYNMGLNTKKGDKNMGQWVIGWFKGAWSFLLPVPFD
jgi:hypothetical protein